MPAPLASASAKLFAQSRQLVECYVLQHSLSWTGGHSGYLLSPTHNQVFVVAVWTLQVSHVSVL